MNRQICTNVHVALLSSVKDMIFDKFFYEKKNNTYSWDSNKHAELLLVQQENVPCALLFATCAIIGAKPISYRVFDVCALCLNEKTDPHPFLAARTLLEFLGEYMHSLPTRALIRTGCLGKKSANFETYTHFFATYALFRTLTTKNARCVLIPGVCWFESQEYLSILQEFKKISQKDIHGVS